MEINGIAHIQLTVRDFQKAVAFYKELLPFLGMQLIYEGEKYYYCVGGRTGLAIAEASPEFKDQPFQQWRAGLHHICFRVRSREDIDELYQFVCKLGAKIIRPPSENNEWAPGYYSLLFEDPEGIRIEANFVPGKGNLDSTVKLPKNWDALSHK